MAELGLKAAIQMFYFNIRIVSNPELDEVPVSGGQFFERNINFHCRKQDTRDGQLLTNPTVKDEHLIDCFTQISGHAPRRACALDITLTGGQGGGIRYGRIL